MLLIPAHTFPFPCDPEEALLAVLLVGRGHHAVGVQALDRVPRRAREAEVLVGGEGAALVAWAGSTVILSALVAEYNGKHEDL